MNLSKLLKAGIFCACIILTLGTLGARGQTFTWTSTADGNWSDPNNWGGTAPTGGATTIIRFNPTDPVTYNATNDLADNPFILNALNFNSTSSGLVTVTTNNPFQFAGISGTGSAVVQSGSNGIVLDATNSFTIGGAGTGTLTIGGATDNNVVSGAGNVTVNFTTVGSSATPNLLLGNVGTLAGNLVIQSGYVKANRVAGDLFGNTTILQVAAGSTFDFANNGETFGGLSGAGNIVPGRAGWINRAAGYSSWGVPTPTRARPRSPAARCAWRAMAHSQRIV
jgi:hypothetical protein